MLAVRNLDKGHEAAASMNGQVEVRRLDLADLSSVRTFAEDFTGPVDVLINNAGVMIPPLTRTADGFELQFGTNHLGQFALTNLLLPRIRARVVTVSSSGHKVGSIDFDDLNWQRKPYQAMRAYAQSNSPTSCSPPSCSGVWPRPAHRCSRPPRTPAWRPRTC